MSYTRYRNGIRAATRGLWAGVMDYDDFVDAMSATIEPGLVRAALEGAAECGINSVDEFSEDETAFVKKTIASEKSHLNGFAEFIEKYSKASGYKLTDAFKRADMWINRYPSVKLTIKSMACADRKYEWKYDPTKEHCECEDKRDTRGKYSCRQLNGKVKRMSYWRDHVLPRNGPNIMLVCSGLRCGCDLVETDKPVSKGPLPVCK